MNKVDFVAAVAEKAGISKKNLIEYKKMSNSV